MRCPKCCVKTTDIEAHIKRCHPECDTTSSDDEDEVADPDYDPKEESSPVIKFPRTRQLTRRSLLSDKAKQSLSNEKNSGKGKESLNSRKLKQPISSGKGKQPLSNKKGKQPLRSEKSKSDSVVSRKGKKPLDSGKYQQPQRSEERGQSTGKRKFSEPYSSRKIMKIDSDSDSDKSGSATMKKILHEIAFIKQQLVKNETGESSQMSKGEKPSPFGKPVNYSRKSSSGKRKKKACPYCPIMVINLPRHMRQKHRQTKDKALQFVRQNRDIITPKGGGKRKYRQCPLKHCLSKVLYLAQHLRKVHGYSSEHAKETSTNIRYGLAVTSDDEDDVDLGSELEIEEDRAKQREKYQGPSTEKENAMVQMEKQNDGEHTDDKESVNTESNDPMPCSSKSKPRKSQRVQIFDLMSDKVKTGWTVAEVENQDIEKTRDIYTPETQRYLVQIATKEGAIEVAMDDTERQRDDVALEIDMTELLNAQRNIEVTELLTVGEEVEVETAETVIERETVETEINMMEDSTIVENAVDLTMTSEKRNEVTREEQSSPRNTSMSEKDEIDEDKHVEKQTKRKKKVEVETAETVIERETVEAEINMMEDSIVVENVVDLTMTSEKRNEVTREEKSSPRNTSMSEKNEIDEDKHVEKQTKRRKKVKEPKKSMTNVVLKGYQYQQKKHKVRNWREVPTIKSYQMYCKSAERQLNARSTGQQCAQLFQMWIAVDKLALFRIGPLTDPDTITKNWLDNFIQLKQPGTVLSYLSTLLDFWTYLSIKKLIRPNRLVELTLRRAQWLKRLRKRVKERRVQIMVRDSRERIQPEDFEKFRKSNLKQEVQKLLSKTATLTQKETNKVVGYISLMIGLDNAQRCGAVNGITLGTYANRKIVSKSTVLTVESHKTGFILPCELVIKEELAGMLASYLIARRRMPLFQSGDLSLLAPDSPIFLQWPGVQIDGSQLSKLINRVWKKAGCTGSVSFTKIRKAVVSRFREVKPGSRVALAKHMSHQPSTADKFYSLNQMKEKAVAISKEIQEVMSTETKKDEGEGTSDPNPVTERSEESEGEGTNDPNSVSERSEESQQEDIVPPSVSTSHGRRSFSRSDQEIIQRSCMDIISSQGSIRQEEVLKLLGESEEGRELITAFSRIYGKMATKKITDRVRTFRKDFSKHAPKQ